MSDNTCTHDAFSVPRFGLRVFVDCRGLATLRLVGDVGRTQGGVPQKSTPDTSRTSSGVTGPDAGDGARREFDELNVVITSMGDPDTRVVFVLRYL